MIVVGALMAIGAVVLYVWAESVAPTLENQLTREWVLREGYYNLARIAALGAGVGGVVLVVLGAVNAGRR